MKNHSEPIFEFANCLSFEVQDERQDMNYFGAWPGVIRPFINNDLSIKQLLDPEEAKMLNQLNA